MKNQKIRSYAKEKNVPFWEVAKALNVSSSTMANRLNQDLSPQQIKQIADTIDQIAREKIQMINSIRFENFS